VKSVKTLDDFIKIEVAEKIPKEAIVQETHDLPDEWRWVKLKEILKEDRQSINPHEYSDKEFFLVTMDCIESNTGKLLKKVKCLGKEIRSMKYKFDTRHVLYGKLRPYLNKVYVPEEEGICTTEFIPFIVTKALREYVAYYLRRKETVNFAMSHITGTRQPRVIIDTFLEYPIPLPPLEEQKRIVSRLELLVSRAEEAKRLRKLAREEAKKIMQAALNKVFSKADEEEKWEWVKLGDERLFYIETGSTPRTDVPEYWDGNIKWVTPKDLGKVTEKFIFDTERKITQRGLMSCSTKIVPKGAIIVSTRAPIGYIAIAGDDMCFNQGCKAIIIKDTTKVLPDFIYYALLTKVEEMNALGSGATFKEISRKKMASMLIPLPTVDEQKRMVAYLDKLREKVVFLESFQQKTEDELEKLIPSILDKAFRGEL
jgi:type I restriction enzyme S subunit